MSTIRLGLILLLLAASGPACDKTIHEARRPRIADVAYRPAIAR
jgi:hypothetical protein